MHEILVETIWARETWWRHKWFPCACIGKIEHFRNEWFWCIRVFRILLHKKISQIRIMRRICIYAIYTSVVLCLMPRQILCTNTLPSARVMVFVQPNNEWNPIQLVRWWWRQSWHGFVKWSAGFSSDGTAAGNCAQQMLGSNVRSVRVINCAWPFVRDKYGGLVLVWLCAVCVYISIYTLIYTFP